MVLHGPEQPQECLRRAGLARQHRRRGLPPSLQTFDAFDRGPLRPPFGALVGGVGGPRSPRRLVSALIRLPAHEDRVSGLDGSRRGLYCDTGDFQKPVPPHVPGGPCLITKVFGRVGTGSGF